MWLLTPGGGSNALAAGPLKKIAASLSTVFILGLGELQPTGRSPNHACSSRLTYEGNQRKPRKVLINCDNNV